MTAVAGLAASATGQPGQPVRGEWVGGEVIVFPTDLETGRNLREQFIQEDFTVLGFAPISGMMIVAVEAGLEAAAVEYFKMIEGVRAAERSHAGRFGSCGGPSTPPTSDPDFDMQWHLHNTEQVITEINQTASVTGTCGVDIDAIRGWQRTRGSPDVWMAVFDSGVELDNPEFEGRLAPQQTWISLSCPNEGVLSGNTYIPSTCCCTGGNCNYGYPHDVHGHGTWVAGTAMANHNDEGVMGVDPGCTLLPVRISAMDNGLPARVIIALEMIDDGNEPSEPYELVKVINMSFQAIKLVEETQQSEALRADLESLREEGVVIVVISGNNEGDPTEQSDGWLPSSSPDVITVGATDNQDRRLAPPVPTVVGSGRGDALDFVAPGFAILTAGCEWRSSTSCDYHCFIFEGQLDPPASGTSGAAPQVAGIVSLLFARAAVLSIDLDFDEVYDLLSLGAVKLGSSGTQHDLDFGWGRVNLYETLMKLESEHYECDADVTHTDSSANFGYGVPDGKVDVDDYSAFFEFYSTSDLLADLTTVGSTSPGGGGANGTPDGLLTSDDVVYFLAFYANCSSLPCPACPP